MFDSNIFILHSLFRSSFSITTQLFYTIAHLFPIVCLSTFNEPIVFNLPKNLLFVTTTQIPIHRVTRVILCACSYQILCPSLIKGVNDPQKMAGFIIGSTSLDEDMYRLGNTKACTTLIFFKIYNLYLWCSNCVRS